MPLAKKHKTERLAFFARKTCGGFALRRELPTRSRSATVRKVKSPQNPCGALRIGFRLNAPHASQESSGSAAEQEKEIPPAVKFDDIGQIATTAMQWRHLPMDIDDTIRASLQCLAEAMTCAFGIVWEDSDGVWSVQMVDDDSDEGKQLSWLISGGCVDDRMVRLVRDGVVKDCAYRLIAVKDIADDVPFGVDRGKVRTLARMNSNIPNLRSMKHLSSTEIPAVVFHSLARHLGIPELDFCDLVLDSSSIKNEITEIGDVEWTLQDYATKKRNCGPFIVFAKDSAKPHVVYYTRTVVKKGEEILTAWGDTTWKVIAEIWLVGIAETVHWYHLYFWKLAGSLKEYDCDVKEVFSRNTEYLKAKTASMKDKTLYFDPESRGSFGVCDFTEGGEKSDDGDRCAVHPLGHDYLHKNASPSLLHPVERDDAKFFQSLGLTYFSSCERALYCSCLRSNEAKGLLHVQSNAKLITASTEIIVLLQDPDAGPTTVLEIRDGFCPPRWLTPPDKRAYGLFANRDITSGEPVEVYAGLLRLREDLARVDGLDHYAYDIDLDLLRQAGYPMDCKAIVVENFNLGNRSRFVNDVFLRPGVCNLEAGVRWYEGEGVPLIVFYAKKNILAGEELITDYDKGTEVADSSYWRIVWKHLCRDMHEYYTRVRPAVRLLERKLINVSQCAKEGLPKPVLSDDFMIYSPARDLYEVLKRAHSSEKPE